MNDIYSLNLLINEKNHKNKKVVNDLFLTNTSALASQRFWSESEAMLFLLLLTHSKIRHQIAAATAQKNTVANYATVLVGNHKTRRQLIEKYRKVAASSSCSFRLQNYSSSRARRERDVVHRGTVLAEIESDKQSPHSNRYSFCSAAESIRHKERGEDDYDKIVK